MEKQNNEEVYTVVYHETCTKNNIEAIHTVTYKKATCTRVDDIILNFHCSRDSLCDECMQKYL